MAARYTDVDLMILRRWNDVTALQAAFDDLIGRVHDVVAATLEKLSVELAERSVFCDFDVKRPSARFWKSDWANRRKEPGIYFQIIDFAPSEVGRKVEDHPSLWVITEDFSKLRTVESSEAFGRAVRGALSAEILKKWDDDEVDISNWPLGRYCSDLSELARVHLVTEPDALKTFILDCVNELKELAPAIDETLQKMTRR